MKIPSPFPLVLALAALALALPASAGTKKSAEDLEKENALLRAENAYYKAKDDLAAKKLAWDKLKKGEAVTPESEDSTSTETPTPPKPVKKTETEALLENLPDSLDWRKVTKTGSDLLVHAGTRVLAPYTIGDDKKISHDGNKLGGYIEFLYSNTWAFQPDGAAASIAYGLKPQPPNSNYQSQWAKRWNSGTKTLESNTDAVGGLGLLFSSDFDDTADFNARLSVEFANDAEKTASTIAGSGDFSAEVGANKHFLQGYTTNSLYTLGLGGSLGATTDRQARRIHTRWLAGLVANIGRMVPVSSTKNPHRMAMASLSLGHAETDNVVLDPADATKSTVLFDGAVPAYRRVRGLALQAELLYPVGDANYAVLGARIYDRTDPGQWSLTLGYSFDPFQFLESFKSKANPAEPAK